MKWWGAAIFRKGLLLESSEEGARIKRLMRRAEGRSTVNCVEFWEQRKVLDRKSSSVEKMKYILASWGSEIPKDSCHLRLSPSLFLKPCSLLPAQLHADLQMTTDRSILSRH